MNKSTYKLQSFKISKYSTVKLDYRPNQIQLQDPFFILTYVNDTQDDNGFIRADDVIPYVDIF